MLHDVKKPQVAFLTSNFEVAKKMGKLFKKLSVVLDTFLSPEDFLIAQLTNKFDLVLIDLDAAMYEGRAIMTRREFKGTNIAFYVSGVEAMKLVANTYSLDHLGYIFSNLDVPGQVKNILMRFNSLHKLKSEVQYYNSYKHDVIPKHNELVESFENMKEELAVAKSELEIIANISEASRRAKSFEQLVLEVFTKIENVKTFNFLKLAQDGMRLVPSEMSFKNENKKLQIPAIWLGKKNSEINELVISLTQNIASTVTQLPVVSLLMSANRMSSNAVILVEVQEEKDLKMNWGLIESALAGAFAQFEFAKKDISKKQEVLSAYDLLNVFNDKSKDENLHLLAFDLSDIFDFKNLRANITFDWAEFWSDFKIKLANIISDGQIYTTSPEQVVIIIDDFIFNESFEASKEFCSRLGLAKYFTGLENFEVNAAKISLREIPFSEYALLNHLNQKKTSQVVKSREI